MKRLILAVLLNIVFLINIPTITLANPIYSSLGPGDSFDLVRGWGVGDFPGNNYQIAASFTPNFDGLLGSLEVAVQSLGGNNEITFSLTNDTSGSPGSLIENFIFSGVPISPTLLFQESMLNPLLSSDSQYWLVASTDPENSMAWKFNNIDLDGDLVNSTDGGTNWSSFTNTMPAFRLNPVPEPSTFLLLGCGLAGLAFYARRRKKE